MRASHSWKWTGSVSQGLLMFNPEKDMKFFNFKESFSWKKMTKYFAICFSVVTNTLKNSNLYFNMSLPFKLWSNLGSNHFLCAFQFIDDWLLFYRPFRIVFGAPTQALLVLTHQFYLSSVHCAVPGFFSRDENRIFCDKS